MNSKLFLSSLLMVLTVAFLNCTGRKSELIYFGKDTCSHCKMIITDKRFGSELVTNKGKVFKFDSIECMNSFEKEQNEKVGSDFDEYLVSTTDNGNLISSSSAYIYEDKNLRSPMGKGYLISDSESALNKIIGTEKHDPILNWNDFKKKEVNKK